jgi:hypothetical protein
VNNSDLGNVQQVLQQQDTILDPVQVSQQQGTKPAQSAFVSAVQIVQNPQVEEVQKAFQH